MPDQQSDIDYAARQQYQRFLEEWQARPAMPPLDPLLAGLGLPAGATAASAMTFDRYYRLLRLAAGMLWPGDFFLRLGQRYNLFDMGVIGYALISAANLRRSWDISLGQRSNLLPHPIHVSREEGARHMHLVLDLPPFSRVECQALCDEWLSSTWRWLCQRLPELADCREIEVHLPFAPPPHAAVYAELFPGRVVFSAERAEMRIPREFHDRPFSTSSPSVLRLCLAQGAATLAGFEGGQGLPDDVRFFLLQNGRIPLPDLEETAAHFRLPPHTLQRRLRGHGLTFKGIVYEVRMALAQRYLLASRMTVQEIGFLLGYEHVTSFHRAFLRHVGTTPERFRERRAEL
ncbi:Urease operon transcriptional activator [compost metagenome]|uniref:Helix-turn-helix domain-containing protein n=1 Tax=Pseudomonas jinjuensis TaxID=198616 RepID=A0A1H0N1W3_9PSED|nr:AraC family transcriptional regulator [Pseudomonas jinjuensis]SDO86515.1 Helix-turn-helix domain-containing protein [Pseudomonas jinjuensis]